MIYLFQGTPGSGKSSVATVDMLEFLEAGGVVACNFDLVPDWSVQLAKGSFKVRRGLQSLMDRAADLYSRCYRIGTSDTCFQLSEILKAHSKGKVKEGSGRLYLDEAQLLFNSRSWQANKGFIEFFTQHRKLGWDVYLIAHSMEMIDKQIRPLIEYDVRLRNLKNIKFLGVIPVSPYPAFLAIFRYAGLGGGSGEILKRRVYTLRPRYSNLYDSMQVFAFDEASQDVSHQGDIPSLEPPKKTEPRNPAPAEPWPRYHQAISLL